MSKRNILLNAILILYSCSNLFVETVNNTAFNNFELLWQGFDLHYAYFNHKKVNWDSVYTVFKPKVSDNTTPQELFKICSEMLSIFNDSHIHLQTPFDIYHYMDTSYSHNFIKEFVKNKYLNNTFTISGGNRIISGKVAAKIGYIHIASFGGNGWYNDIDIVLDTFRNLDGIIIDVRDNGGGNTNNSNYIAGRFTDTKRKYCFSQFRNGVHHYDFSEITEYFQEPTGPWQFIKTVIVLTNRYCASSTEHFVLSMKTFPHVQIIGDTTTGSTGNPFLRELPNGWRYAVPRGILYDLDMNIIEDVGIAPDIYVSNFTDTSDTILEIAISLTSNN